MSEFEAVVDGIWSKDEETALELNAISDYEAETAYKAMSLAVDYCLSRMEFPERMVDVLRQHADEIEQAVLEAGEDE